MIILINFYKGLQMIPVKYRHFIANLARKYKASAVILFGSSIDKWENAHDFDIGVKGIPPHLFFDFYAELYKNLPKPVDLVDLSHKSMFNDLVERDGVKIYG
jgi:predicted nucleotidyltransferase